MKNFALVALLALSLLRTASVFAGEAVAVRLSAQLWARPLGAENRLNIRKLGEPVTIAANLELREGANRLKKEFGVGLVRSSTLFILKPAVDQDPPYIVTQVQLFNAGTGALVAECSNYDSIRGEVTPGVGACSGVIGGSQFGLTFSRIVTR